jgi:hypothetical protein
MPLVKTACLEGRGFNPIYRQSREKFTYEIYWVAFFTGGGWLGRGIRLSIEFTMSAQKRVRLDDEQSLPPVRRGSGK